MRRLLAATILALAMAGSGAARAATGEGGDQYDETSALAVSQGAIGRPVGDAVFRDVEGREVRLSSFRGKPHIVSFVYTSCYHTCPLITEALDHAVGSAQSALGTDSFAVLTIGFDARNDTPKRMRAFAYEHGIRQPNWHMLSGDEETIRQLADALGFIYFASPRGFDHLAQTTILDAEGKVYAQVYGADFSMPSIVEPLKDLVFGRVRDFSSLTGIANRIRLFCTLYDPRNDRYYFDYSVFIGLIIGAASLAGVGTILARNVWRLWRQGRPA